MLRVSQFLRLTCWIKGGLERFRCANSKTLFIKTLLHCSVGWASGIWLPDPCVSDEQQAVSVRKSQRMSPTCVPQCWGSSTGLTGGQHVSAPSIPARPPRPHHEHRGEELHASEQDHSAVSKERFLLFLVPARQPAGNDLLTSEAVHRAEDSWEWSWSRD